MIPCRIYKEDWDVDQRLQRFGVTRGELIHVVQQVVAARGEAVENDPLTTSGQFAYIYGTRHLRALFRSKKWLLHRKENIESVKHPEKSLNVVYQSVDHAASEIHSPRAISGKGAGADRIIDLAQGKLFSDEELERLNPVAFKAINTGFWFFCVSVSGEDVRAELSLPLSLEGRNFKRFIERIFVVRGGEWGKIKVELAAGDDAVEFEPMVTRKK